MNTRAVGVVALTAGVACFGIGCERDAGPAQGPPPPMVEVATPEVRDVTEYFNYTGTLQAVENTQIRARVTGYLESVHFAESTDVKAGDLLFTIEQAPYEIAVGRAEATLERMKAARDLAYTQFQRIEKALEAQAATELEMLEGQAELDQAEADVLLAERELEDAKLNLSYTQVRSPIDGRVDRNYVDVGNLVGGPEATVLARVVTLDPMHVWFDVSERISLRYLSRGRDGTVDEKAPPVAVGLADEPGFPHAGMVDFVDNVLDEGTGTLRVRAVLPNPTRKLYPGLFARIRVPWETREDTIVIHEEAVGTGLDGKYVMVVNATNTVERRPVALGERQDDGTIAVLDGLTAEDRYIVRGIQKARPGAPVDPQPFQSAAAPAGPGDSRQGEDEGEGAP